MRKHVVAAAVVVVMLAGAVAVTSSAGAAGTGGTPYRLQMSGAQEFDANGVAINPHGNADRGSVVLTLNQGQGRICWSFGALTLTAGEALPFMSHIHEAPRGVGGPIRVHLFGSGGAPAAPTSYPTATTCVDVDPALVKTIRQHPERYYVNLHNTQHPAGAVRAQLG